jgi:hypothetical protein
MSKEKNKLVDIEELTLTDEPFTSNRPSIASKYDDFFSTISPNKRIKVAPQRTQAVAQSLRCWIKRNKKAGVVKSIAKAGDGMGGVWWIVEQKAPKTVWAPLEGRRRHK